MNKEPQGVAPYAGPPKALTERNAAMAAEVTQGVAPEKPAPGHNPHHLTNAQVGEGWRLLGKDEIIDFNRLLREVEAWQPEGRYWHPQQSGKLHEWTYRTRLSREKLRAARGLEPEPAPEPLCVSCPECGCDDPKERCNGCSHDFRPAPAQGEGEEPSAVPCPKCGMPRMDDNDLDGSICPDHPVPPAPAQAISAEERADLALKDELDPFSRKFGALKKRFAAALTAHAAQEVSRVEGACKAELAERHAGYKATCKALEEAQSELAQLRETLTRVRPSADAYNRVCETLGIENDILGFVKSLRETLAQKEGEVEKLAAFKAYVHRRLDEAGIEKDPESSHKAEGCRIGGRLDLVLQSLARVEGERDGHKAIIDAVIHASGWYGVECGIAPWIERLTAERDALKLERDELRNRIQTDFMSGVAMELERERDALKAQVEELRGLDTETRVRFYEHDFYMLSNFSSFQLRWKGQVFATSEAAYHWEKFPGMPLQADIINAPSAHEAYKVAERYKTARRSDWDEVKVSIMLELLFAKVEQHEYVRRKLLATGTRELVEDSWRDDFWGWGPNRDGQNMLGKLWMEVRSTLEPKGQE